MGCLVSKGRNYHTIIWTFRGHTESEVKEAILQAVIKLAKYELNAEKTTSNELYIERKTASMGFIDDLTLKLKEDNSIVTVECHSISREGLNDWGQNKRNLKQLKAAIELPKKALVV